MITVDKRKSRRLNVLHSGLIASENGDGISCEILNMSPFGACLQLGITTEVPETFVLVVEADLIRWPCRVIWREHTQVGVAFK
jgi:PilZ domain-containing protein